MTSFPREPPNPQLPFPPLLAAAEQGRGGEEKKLEGEKKRGAFPHFLFYNLATG